MPTPGQIANRRLLVYLLAAAGLVSFLFVALSRSNGPGPRSSDALAYAETPIHHVDVQSDTLKGETIMPKLGNETLKQELGRASWKLLHTTMARFPEKPNQDEQTALFSYLHLFARLYPCGECAGHFRQILAKFPPQVSSRNAAAAWACHVHNEVNHSLKKKTFDCNNIGDFYDCGCAEDGEEGAEKKTAAKASSDNGEEELKLVKEGKVAGG